MKKVYLFFAVFLVFYFQIKAQTHFTYAIGGGSSETGTAMVMTSTNDYIFVGTTKSYGTGSSKMILAKVDASGVFQWSKVYGTTGKESTRAIVEAPGNTFYILGTTDYNDTSSSNQDAYVLHIDEDGNQLATSKRFTVDGSERVSNIIPTNDGGYMIAGHKDWGTWGKHDDLILIKTDANLTLQWSGVYASEDDDYPLHIQQLPGNDFIIAGAVGKYPPPGDGINIYDMIVIRADKDGNIIWGKQYTMPKNDYMHNFLIDGSVIYFIGHTNTYGAGGYDACILKTDLDGNVDWLKMYGGDKDDTFNAIMKTSDGNIILSGQTNSKGFGSNDMFLMKIDTDGNMSWIKAYGGEEDDGVDINAFGLPSRFGIKEISDESIIFLGNTGSFGSGSTDLMALKTDKNGNLDNKCIVKPITFTSTTVNSVSSVEKTFEYKEFGAEFNDPLSLVTSGVTVMTDSLPGVDLGPDTSICQNTELELHAPPTFTYQWNTGATDSVITATLAGSYAVTITNSFGCFDRDTITMGINAIPSALINPATSTAKICSGDTLEIDGNPTAGDGVITTHQWTGDTATINDTTIQKPVFDKATPGNYKLYYKVTDTNRCFAIDSVTVTVWQLPTTTIIPDDDAAKVCQFSDLNLNGNPTKGSGNISQHNWTGTVVGDALNQDNIQTPVFNYTTAGTYQLTYKVTDDNTCKAKDSVVITVYENPAASPISDKTNNTVCSDLDLNIDGKPTKGTGNITTHQWTVVPAVAAFSSNSTQESVFNYHNAGTYTLTYKVTDDLGCSDNENLSVIINGAPQTGIAATHSTCQNVPLNLDGNATKGTGTITTHSWEGDAQAINALLETDKENTTFEHTDFGTYHLTYRITDDKSCEDSAKISIRVFKNPSVAIVPPDDTMKACANTIYPINCSIIKGDATIVNQKWISTTGSLAKLSTSTNANTNFSSTTDGVFTYQYQATDANNCQTFDSITILINMPNLTSMTVDDQIICNGDSTQVHATSTGFTPMTYVWNSDQTTFADNTNASTFTNKIINPLSNNVLITASVTVTDVVGCVINDALTFKVRPEIKFENFIEPPICFEETQVLSGDVIGGTGNPDTEFSYNWRPTTAIDDPAKKNPTITGSQITVPEITYRLIVTDSAKCTDSLDLNVTRIPLISVDIGNNFSVCKNKSTTLEGVIAGSAYNYSYNWLNSPAGSATIVNNTASKTQITNITDSTKFYLTVNYGTGCKVNDSITVGVNDPVVSIREGNFEICSNANFQLNAAIQDGTGHGEVWYDWSVFENMIESEPAQIPVSLNSSTAKDTLVTIKVRDKLNCLAYDTITVSIFPEITNTYPDTLIICSQRSETISGIAQGGSGDINNYQFKWTDLMQYLNDTTIANPIASPKDTSTLQLIIFDEKKCTDTATVFLNLYPTIDFSSAKKDITCHNDNDGEITVTPTANQPYFYSFNKNDYSTTNIFNNLQQGNYTVTVKDTNDCVSVDTIKYEIINPEALSIEITSIKDNLCYGDTNGEIQVSAKGGVGELNYCLAHMSFSQASSKFEHLLAADYEVFVVDRNGCIKSIEAVINEPEELIFEIDSFRNVTCGEENNGYIVTTQSGGTEPYEITWLNQATHSVTDLFALVEGKYNGRLTDANGCTKYIEKILTTDSCISELLVPNIFSPNNDGINDLFKITCKDMKQFNIIIYNRWGKKIYESTDYSGSWDGLNQNTGKEAAAGVYFYVIIANGKDSKQHIEKGAVQLVR